MQEEKLKSFSAYHKSHENGEFGDRNYYYTKKTQPQVGDTVYVFSGDLPRQTQYTLEGRFVIQQIESRADGQRKLIFNDENRVYVNETVNGKSWFGKDFFNRFITVGVNSILDEYKIHFDSMIQDSEAKVLDAIDDLSADTLKIEYHGIRYTRNSAVRAAVLRRAAGQCEYCGRFGFIQDNGTRYLETHHIISLAEQGPDSTSNVIAICAGEHREAHFGAKRLQLEQEFISKLKNLVQR